MSGKPFVRRLLRWSAAHRLGEYILRILTEPQIGAVDWSTLRRPFPISRWFGSDRGKPIDRVFIEDYLQQNASRIRGAVLEIAEDTYTRRYGTARVISVDVLHALEGNPAATIVGDLTNAPHIPDNSFDCIILTQTMQMIYDLPAAVRTLHRILKPGGSVLATLPGISQVSRVDMEQWGDLWRFTTASAQKLFEEAFSREKISLNTYGNVVAAVALLHGLASEDLHDEKLRIRDPDYQVLIGVCATKSLSAA